MSEKYTIDDFGKRYLEDQLKRLNKRAAKLGVEPIWYEFFDTRLIPIKVQDDFDKTKYHTKYVREHDVAICGESPKIAGWEFAATVEHKETGNVLRKSPFFEHKIPERYRTTDSLLCEHCNSRRRRNDTYLVYEEATDTFKQVGSGCIRDFLGHKNPHAVADWVEYMGDILAQLLMEMRRPRGEGGHYVDAYRLEEVMTDVCAIVRISGWMSGKKAEIKGVQSTKEIYSDLESAQKAGPKRSNYEAELMEKYQATEADVERGKTIVEWVRNKKDIKPDDEYLNNMQITMNDEFIEWRDVGLVASSTIAYWWAIEKPLLEAKEKAEKPVSEWVGKLKERLRNIPAEIEWVHKYRGHANFYGDDGEKMMLKIRDEKGNLYVWFTGPLPVEVGQKVTLTGTVKNHDEYKGTKQTIITRCALHDEKGEKIQW